MAVGWGSKTNATQLTSITTIQYFDQIIALAPNQMAHVEVECDPPGSPVDHLVVEVFRTLDDSSENWDDTPCLSFLISNAIDPNKRSFVLDGGYRHRVGVRRNGTTTTFTSADMSFRLATLS